MPKIAAEASTEDHHTLAEARGKTKRGTKSVSVDAGALGRVLRDYVRLQQYAGPDYRTTDEA